MARRYVVDQDAITRFRARSLVAKLRGLLPGSWGRHVEILAVHPAGVPVWLRDASWLERVEAFKAKHGEALHWNLSDSDICDKARELAGWFGELMELKNPDCCDAEKLDKVCAVCDLVGVDYPVAISALGAVNRVLSDVWWRRVLRRKVARVVEAGAIKLGVVNRREGGYASADAVARRGAQIKRNAAMMEKTLLKNEAGQVFTLSELAKRSTANPEIRGGELMVRIRGCEEYATAAGHVGYFVTLTCPSQFHAVQSGGKGPRAVMRQNPKYNGISTPRDAQLWLRGAWARVRAAWARAGVLAYGFRVAEPHHDGCPHWHCLLWFQSDGQAIAALQVVGRHWLADGGAVEAFESRADVLTFKGGAGATHEPGALKNRVNIKRMIKGGAAGYVAKYVAKNIGHFDVGVHLDGLEVDTREVKGWERVDAWAATWGIRQFQAIGQPSVTVWRELRRVTKDQVELARVRGDKVADKIWQSTQKIGGLGADWCRYMMHQGGVCLGRAGFAVRSAFRVTPDHVNGYGEAFTQKRIIGCAMPSGRVLVSRRQAWQHVGADVELQSSGEREARGAPWTGFINCTARLGGTLRAALLSLDLKGVRYGVVNSC